ncbi:hypothetical protein K432DRAFT_385829, partial [Lepidopterella palustris CBS 459.81]
RTIVVKQARANSALNIYLKRDLTSLSKVTDYKTGEFLRSTIQKYDLIILYANNKYKIKLVPRILFKEAKVLKFLKQYPHPNIVKYHGYIYRYKDIPYNLNITACINGIRAGIRHLYSLRLAHNDLNPTNIALNGNDNPIILDFGSCKKFGKELLLGGTYS